MKKVVFVVSLVSSLFVSAVALVYPFGKVKVVDAFPDYFE